MYKTFRCAASAAVLASALIGGPSLAQQPMRQNPSAMMPAVAPKKSVAVTDVAVNAAFQQQYGSFAPGGGLAAMLETELARSNQFRIAQRSHLDAALYEQQLGELGLNKAKTAKAGELTGAQYLIRAAVTDFSVNETGGGLNMTGNLGQIAGALAPKMREGRITIDFQVIDTTTGEVVDGFSVSRKLRTASIAVSASRGGRTVSGNSFSNTPLGETARAAMGEAANRIAMALRDRDWSAQVAQIRGQQLYVNVGADGGLRIGDTVRIHRVVDRITDPVTGAFLGIEKADIGQATISAVQGQYATASYRSSEVPQTGDIVTLGR